MKWIKRLLIMGACLLLLAGIILVFLFPLTAVLGLVGAGLLSMGVLVGLTRLGIAIKERCMKLLKIEKKSGNQLSIAKENEGNDVIDINQQKEGSQALMILSTSGNKRPIRKGLLTTLKEWIADVWAKLRVSKKTPKMIYLKEELENTSTASISDEERKRAFERHNYNRVLELTALASSEDISRSARHLLRRYHPDCGVKAGVDQMEYITCARDRLLYCKIDDPFLREDLLDQKKAREKLYRYYRRNKRKAAFTDKLDIFCNELKIFYRQRVDNYGSLKGLLAELMSELNSWLSECEETIRDCKADDPVRDEEETLLIWLKGRKKGLEKGKKLIELFEEIRQLDEEGKRLKEERKQIREETKQERHARLKAEKRVKELEARLAWIDKKEAKLNKNATGEPCSPLLTAKEEPNSDQESTSHFQLKA